VPDSDHFRYWLCTRVMNPHPRKATCNGSGMPPLDFFWRAADPKARVVEVDIRQVSPPARVNITVTGPERRQGPE
jgi:hypothetical protein